MLHRAVSLSKLIGSSYSSRSRPLPVPENHLAGFILAPHDHQRTAAALFPNVPVRVSKASSASDFRVCVTIRMETPVVFENSWKRAIAS